MGRSDYGVEVDPLVGAYQDFLPVYGALPMVKLEDVGRFTELGQEGNRLQRDGDLDGAERAFKAQLDIFTLNPEPLISLALIEATRGEKEQAILLIEEAVKRGFTDLLRVERAEAWALMRGDRQFRYIQSLLPQLKKMEDGWADWKTFRAVDAPESLAEVLDNRKQMREQIRRLSPLLGERLVRLSRRLTDRVSAALIEEYVDDNPEADDLEEALKQLMTLYSGGLLQRWVKLSEDAAERLGTVSELALKRLPDSPIRPAALVGTALAQNVQRTKDGALKKDAASKILSALSEVVERFPESQVVSTAMVGLIRTDLNVGEEDRAETRYRAYAESPETAPEVMLQVRRRLGRLSLRLGGLPEFRADTVDGKPFDSASLEGKVVVVDFWATWCPPCIEEFPTLRKIDERHGEEVLVLGVNMDYAEDLDRETLGSWIARNKLPGSHVHDGLGWESDLVQSFGVSEIPFNVVVGPDGNVLAIDQHGKKLEKAIRSAVRAD